MITANFSRNGPLSGL